MSRKKVQISTYSNIVRSKSLPHHREGWSYWNLLQLSIRWYDALKLLASQSFPLFKIFPVKQNEWQQNI